MIESVVRRTYALRGSIDEALKDNVDDVISVALRECDGDFHDFFLEIMNKIARKIRRNGRSNASFERLFHQGNALRVLVHSIYEHNWMMIEEALDELEREVYHAEECALERERIREMLQEQEKKYEKIKHHFR